MATTRGRVKWSTHALAKPAERPSLWVPPCTGADEGDKVKTGDYSTMPLCLRKRSEARPLRLSGLSVVP